MCRRAWILVCLGLGCGPPDGATRTPDAAPGSETGRLHREKPPRRGRSAAASAERCEDLEALARCVQDGISSLQREPVTGELALFVTEAQSASVPGCAGLSADAVAWERSETGMSHYDDGHAEVHIEYRFRKHQCPPATMQIDLSMGG